MRNDWLSFACWAAIIMILPGCGRGQNVPKTAAVHGCVKLDGKPVEGADVGFYYQGAGGRPAIGKTDVLGRYSLSTFGVNDGAILGQHAVVISKFVFGSGATGSAGQATGNAGKSAPPPGPMELATTNAKSVLPLKYSKASESGLTVEVKPEGGEFNFDLTSR
jgi:hypothetical protein